MTLLRALVPALFACLAGTMLYRCKDLPPPSYRAMDVPIHLKTGTTLSQSFVPEVDQPLYIILARPISAPRMNESMSNETQEVAANFRITSGGKVLVEGQYPPQVGRGRGDGVDYGYVESFQPMRGQMHELVFEVIGASAAAEETDARLQIALHPVFGRQKGDTLALLGWGSAFAAIISGLLLLQRRSG